MPDNQPDHLHKLRHSASHLLGAAVEQLYPDAKRTIGPAIDNGFYYDFDFGSQPISDDDLPKIEAKMHELVKDWKGFERHELSADEAENRYKNNQYKNELIKEFSDNGAKKVSFYQSGNFWDLCKGGHIDNPSKELQHFKLLSIAGAYWRGDEKNPMLTRIYGTAFDTQAELDAYLQQQADAKLHDHKKLGKELGLFIISPKVGSGFPLYMPNGALLRRALETWLIEEKEKRGFKFVWTPHVAKSDLYKQSGHWQKYDAMFQPMKIDDEEYVLKPMNCPHHFQIFNAVPRSYKEMPLIIAENATVYRYEKAGELNGLLRVRALTQDDTHAFIRPQDVAKEIDNILELMFAIFGVFKFKKIKARISVRDPKNPDKYLGKPEIWDKAEAALIDAVKIRDMEYFVGEGEAAFYGPKIDIMVSDALGREWQLTTVQLDFVQPENFDMSYINEKGEAERPAVLHVAILGSIDRFLAILIEHYAGAFPAWLAPVQVKILPIADRHFDYAKKVLAELKAASLRVEVDDRPERLPAKIRDAQMLKIPYMLIVGDKEAENAQVAVRKREGGEQEVVSVGKFIEEVKTKIARKE